MTGVIDAFAATLRQDGRATNEDAFLIRPGRSLVVALADGEGNAEQAARHALRRLERSVAAAGADEMQVFATWSGWFRAIDAAMRGGSQTTLIALSVGEGRVLGAAAGDSQVYLWNRQGELRILNQGAAKPRLGSRAAAPAPIHVPFERGETLLLMSDGARSPLPLARLSAIIAKGRSRRRPSCRRRFCGRRGGRGEGMT